VFLGIGEQKPLKRTLLLGRVVYQTKRRLDIEPVGGVVMGLLVVHVPEGRASGLPRVGRHRIEQIIYQIERSWIAHLGDELLMLLLVIEHERRLSARVVRVVEEADDAHPLRPQMSSMHLSQKRTVQPSALDMMSGT